MSAQPPRRAITPVSSTDGLKNGVEPIALESLAPRERVSRYYEALFFCTLGGEPPRSRGGRNECR